ncbi:bifunctional metallophosphatase/5'-nucleotidase [Palleronia sp. LCG004]|uniref:bifunctional metallophosphatase/5'-nucleotidase n=1 Tax=Palleronia sp. LCG004 TaxID=3079304 RepID=UPI002942C5DE|nr:5'-nucleotidase C-terminal domain-containing protein [Palleronia sp. LCG004]WOI56779.1 5'-nucleotidase C-terminal domain-containing protein [Palleronia sp. LCG004]
MSKRLQDKDDARKGPKARGRADHSEIEVSLRLLATSDLHGWARQFDYVSGEAAPGRGIESVLPVVAALREENPNSLLFDVGDFLTGSTLGDVAMQGAGIGPNPIVAAMNVVGYDAATLGNHEFDYGCAALDRALEHADFPVVTTNILRGRGESPLTDCPLREGALLLRRRVRDRDGDHHDLRIGIVAFLPETTLEQTRAKHADVDALGARPIAEAARGWIAHLRESGADLVIALCHDGVEDGRDDPVGSPLDIARAGGVDAIFMGHFHQVFPSPEATGPARPGIDARKGFLGGVPAAMPGCWGRHVAVVDLTLVQDATGRWQAGSEGGRIVGTATPPRRKVPAAVLQARKLHEVTSDAHEMCLVRGGTPLATMPAAATSYFARLGRCPITMIVARVMANALKRHMPDRPALPVIGMAAPARSGGAGGAGNYAAIAPGALRRSHLDLLAPFPDRICAVEVTGAELRDLFERSVAGFRRISSGSGNVQPLVDARLPGLSFLMSPDAHAVVDLSREAKFDWLGRRAGEGRIASLVVHGREVRAGDRYLLAVNDFRAHGGGALPGCRAENMRWQSDATVRDVVLEEIGEAISEDLWNPGFTLSCPEDVDPVFRTGRGAQAHLSNIADLGPVRRPGGGNWLDLRLTEVGSALEIER